MISDITLKRLSLLAERCKAYSQNPRLMPVDVRTDLSIMFASTLHSFVEFAELGMKYLGFEMTEIQADIAWFMQHGARKSMVQAQRGQAKSTLAALFAIWSLVHNPSARVLIVSAGEKQSSDVATMIIRLLENWSILCWLRADSSAGDRTSYENYDVHYSLKGIDKSASISCVGITANLQGKRADLLIPDDVETQKNSMTQVLREQLLMLTKEFAAICTHGDTLYLGTPQTKDSIYRTLPNRGFEVRVWTGRYPTSEELLRYDKGVVAPCILEALERDSSLGTGGGITGLRGKPTDPMRFDEIALQEKELDYGEEGFNLQYMLDTTLSDALRTRIKLSDIPIIGLGSENAPETILWAAEPRLEYKERTPNLMTEKLYYAASSSDVFVPYSTKVMQIDPAGSGGDEVAFCVGGAVNSYVHVFSTGGFKGGMTEENINRILDIAVQYEVDLIRVEANMGHGVVTALIQAQMQKRGIKIGTQDFYPKGQKERRIIDTISPLTRRHKLIVHAQCIQDDWAYCEQHPSERRMQFSLMRQLADITYDRNSLAHDDRADCVQALCEFLVALLAKDDEKEAELREEAKIKEWLKNPMQYVQDVPVKRRGRVKTYGHR